MAETTTKSSNVNRVRVIVARVVWAVFLLFALVLAGAALLMTLEANPDNTLVEFVANFADRIDLGLFDLDNPIKDFGESVGDKKKTALFNYGIGAIIYLIVGRILERAIRP